jgi:hypothetical protein
MGFAIKVKMFNLTSGPQYTCGLELSVMILAYNPRYWRDRDKKIIV